MLLNPKYDAIPLYITAKFLSGEDKIHYIKEVIEGSGEAWHNTKDISMGYIDNSDVVEIDAHKLQYLSLIGFETTSLFTKKINEIDPNHDLIPVILLNGGLLGIKSMSNVYPKILFWDDTKLCGWIYHRHGKNSTIEEFADFDANDYMIVDDTIQTGDTYEEVRKKITQDNGTCVQCIPFIIPTTI